MKKLFQLLAFASISFVSFQAWANLPYYPIQFPRDDAAHYANTPYPVTNMMEWWYYNGTLISKTGRKLGYYVSFNYVQRQTKQGAVLVPFLQIQVADADNQKVYGAQKYFIDNKSYSMSTSNLDVAYGKDLTLRKNNDTYLVDCDLQAKQGPSLRFSLQLTPTREPLFLNKTGLIDMGDNTNSYYYSWTHVKTQGYIQIGNETFEIDPDKSLSWMDHQWGDFLLLTNQWMWASVQLKNGIEINLSTTPDYSRGFADIVMPDNSRIYINNPKRFLYLAHPVQPGQRHPISYDLSIPEIRLQARIDAIVPGQDVNGIWEGASTVVGTYQGTPVEGQANTENHVNYKSSRLRG